MNHYLIPPVFLCFIEAVVGKMDKIVVVLYLFMREAGDPDADLNANLRPVCPKPVLCDRLLDPDDAERAVSYRVFLLEAFLEGCEVVFEDALDDVAVA